MRLSLNTKGKYNDEASLINIPSSELHDLQIAYVELEDKAYMYFSEAVVGDLKPIDAPEKGFWFIDKTINFSNILKVVSNDYDFTSNDCVDASSIENWNQVIINKAADYKLARKEIKNLFFAEAGSSLQNWADVDPERQRIAAAYFLIPKSLRDLYYTTKEQYILGEEFHTRAIECRTNRAYRVLTILRVKLNQTDADSVVDDLNETYEKINGKRFSRNLLDTYLILGREGTSSGDPTGVYDYFEDTGDYDGEGFISKGFIPIEGTIPELVLEIMDVFRNGIIN